MLQCKHVGINGISENVHESTWQAFVSTNHAEDMLQSLVHMLCHRALSADTAFSLLSLTFSGCGNKHEVHETAVGMARPGLTRA